MALITKIIHAAPPNQYTITGPGITPDEPIKQLENIISGAFGILTIIAVIFFTIQIILAGYAFISSEGDKEKIKVARTKITNGILGITIVAVAFGLTAFLADLLGLGKIFDLTTIIDNLKLK